MNILITGVGGPTPRSFAYSLKEYSSFADYRLIAMDINPLAIGLYQKDVFDQSYLIPRAGEAGYWETIHQIIETERINVAVIQPEAEVLEWSRYQQKYPLPCPVILPQYDLATMLVDKARMTEVLDSTGLVPKSVSFQRDDTLEPLFSALKFPFWVRSSSGTSGLGSLRVDSKEALQHWIEINPDVDSFLASTYLPGRNMACKLLYFEGKLLRSACAERVEYIMAKVAPPSITGNTSFGRLINEPELTEVAVLAMEHLFVETGTNKHGFFTVDFKEDSEGQPYITEINIRHVAFTQCFAAAGANFAEDTIRLLSKDPSFDRNYRNYEFEEGLIFLRDVDERPILMNESDLLST